MSEVNHKDRAHSEIGASSAHRWMACPASVSLSRDMGDSGTSKYAEEGSAAHELSDACLEQEKKASEFIGEEFNGFEVTKEMADYVQFYLNGLYPYIDGGYDTFVEEKFELKEIHEDMFGSNDFLAAGIENGELVVIDLKYGKGLNVEAEDNIQLIIYALGAYYDLDFIYSFKNVKLIICQPRMEGKEWKTWEISREELLEYEDKLKVAVKEVYSKDPKISSGAHCRFCKAKHKCPELKRQTEEVVNESFDSVPIEYEAKLPDPNSLDDAQIIKILRNRKAIEEYMKAVSSYAKSKLEKGEELEGYKLVRARTNRKIKDTEEVINQFEGTFGDKLYDKKLMAMSKLETLVGKKELAPFIYKPEGDLTVAPESDKRESVDVKSLEDHFDEDDFDNMEF